MSGWAGIDEFVAVAQARSFTQAARKLGVSTSQVSREIGRLEDRVGQRLFFRTTRHVSLTEAGERLFLQCRRLHDERDDALASLVEDATQLQGYIRVTSAVAYGERFVVPLINSFMTEHPKIRVELVLTNDVLDLVDLGIDLAVRFGRLPDSGLIATRLSSRTRHLCAAPDYIDRHGAPRSLDELADHICLRGTAEAWTFSRGGRAYVHRVHGRFICNSGYAVLDAALAGIGLCQLPDFYVSSHIQAGRLIDLLTDHRPEDEAVWAVYPHRRHLPLKVKALLDHLQKAFAARREEPSVEPIWPGPDGPGDGLKPRRRRASGGRPASATAAVVGAAG